MKYTYIIVGAGSAGCVLANRLSADPKDSVLLIEAGPEDSNPLIRIPMGVGRTLADPKLNWYYATEPEAGNAHRPRVWLRGKTLGGSSSINGMMYMRGQPQDYDRWEELGNAGWGWKDIGRCFREMEDHELGDDGERGVGGPLHISIQTHRSALTEAVLQAGVAIGLKRKEDINRPEQEGIGYTPVTIRKGRRVSAADAFLHPVRERPNLHVTTETTVNRVLFDGLQAIGVEAIKGGKTVSYEAQEVILAAGALQSPKILQLSGIGPAEHLASLGIAVVANNPGVGMNLREHKVLTMQVRLRKPYSHNAQLQGARLYWNLFKYWIARRGPLGTTYDITAFVRTAATSSRPDAQLTFWSLTFDRSAQGIKLENEPGMLIMGYPLRTESEGSVQLRSADPADPPTLRTNFLAAGYDRQVIINMFRLMRKFVQQPMLRGLIESETFPGPGVETDAEILDACRQDDTCMHAIGTCRMGRDEGAVVDSDLRVHGVRGLRVVDCSVMPTQVSGNTNGPVMALAWRAAERIRKGHNADNGRTRQ